MARAVSGLLLFALLHQFQIGQCGVELDSSHSSGQTTTPEYPNSCSMIKAGLNSRFGFLANCYPVKKSRIFYESLKKRYLIKSPRRGNNNQFHTKALQTANTKKTTIKWPFAKDDFKLPIQSPVDVITAKLEERKDLPHLDIFEPELPDVQAHFSNSGHTVFVKIEGDGGHGVKPSLTGGPLKNKFVFEQMHFHWGSQDVWGSEHMIDGEAFAAEIHMVHFNSGYKTFKEALEEDDGLSVLTIFAEITDEDNELLNPLYNFLPMIKEPNSAVSLPWNEAMKWATSALSVNTEYYTYPGSLTTPDYNQNVAFIILPKPISISHNQVRGFRELHGHGLNGFINDNKRNLQPLHHRPLIKGSVAPRKKSILEQDD